MGNHRHSKKHKRRANDDTGMRQSNAGKTQSDTQKPLAPLPTVRKWLREWTRADVIQALVFVGVAAGVGVAIWANRQSDEQFWIEHGPKIAATEARFVTPPAVGQPLSVEIHVRNTGDLPATVIPDGKIQIGDMAFFPDGAYANIDGQRILLPNGASATFTITRKDPLTPTEWAGLQDGSKELIVHGAGAIRPNPAPPTPIANVRFCYQWLHGGLTACDNRGFINTEKAIFR